ncbi:TIGR03013 family XrtA/PEP-CTERM system glycosyltransferase [Kordiimonas gwangyangensis]|uniref:TIGR03013 family XrtA/PEP-CTERM system glycosyltransferase n=1 Tax=Kordiimonas gwangyangensis TaxID=288022 RepID=UPI0003703D22|nr:TIGR03013 family XrtA/PEP-CTERM system glycosyltransferase [Kordiimonas gwangyangensis]
MVRIFRHYVSPVKLTLALADIALVFSCVIVAEFARYAYVGLPWTLAAGFEAWIAKLLVPLSCVSAMLGIGAYHADAIQDFRIFVIRLAVSLVAAGMFLSAVLYFLPMLPLWRSILVLSLLISAVVLFISHGLFQLFGSNSLIGRRVLVLGAGKLAAELQQYTAQAREAGLNIVDIVMLPGETKPLTHAIILDDIETLDKFAMERDIEMIILANEDEATSLPLEPLIACKLAGIEIKDRLSFYEQVRGYVELTSVRSEWIIFSDGFRGGTGIERIAKRLLDIAVSMLLLLITLPVMLVVAVLVKVTSRGPVFYRQERVGMHGQTFKLLKFRSMRQDAEAMGAPQWAQKNDPRVTPVGAFLRKTRLDEIPQVINVLSGSMSFVGPRPERPFFVDQLSAEVPFYRERHCVKPGITGWAQIQYPYGASVEDARRKLEYDLYYIKNYSLFLDLLIILQTMRVILFPSGAR